MAGGELRHKNVVSGAITEDEYEAIAQHILNNAVDGDFIYWDAASGGFKRIVHKDLDTGVHGAGGDVLATDADIVVHAALGTGIHEILKVKKSADEIVNNSTTLQNDDHILIAVEANKIYYFYLFLRWEQVDILADLDIKWAVPSGTTMMWGRLDPSASLYHQATEVGILSGGNANIVNAFFGQIVVSGTPGNLQLTWAQNVQKADNTTIKKGSFLLLHEIA